MLISDWCSDVCSSDLTTFFTLRIRKLPVGRAWEALREDETASRALGINPTNTKLTAFAIGAMFGGFGGSFFAARQGFISPESFTFLESAVIIAIVVLGGMGSQPGIDRKRGVSGKMGSVRVTPGGRHIIKKKTQTALTSQKTPNNT